jgi:hypothetical protein
VLAKNSKNEMLVGYIEKDMNDYECHSESEVLPDVTHFVQTKELIEGNDLKQYSAVMEEIISNLDSIAQNVKSIEGSSIDVVDDIMWDAIKITGKCERILKG